MKQFTGILEFIKLYKQNPLENFSPTNYQNYTFGFNKNELHEHN